MAGKEELMNVEISLLYRDASNYKAWSTHVFESELSEEEIAKIAKRLVSCDDFVPEDVGLENPRDSFPREGYELGKDDHCYCEITDVVPTNAEAGEERSFEEFAADVINRMEDIGWTVFDPVSGYNGEGMRRLPEEKIRSVLDSVLVEAPAMKE